MANTQAIKRRIKSVKSTRQITKAMELVSASKMRRAQDATLKSRPANTTAREILTRIAELMNVSIHPLYARRELKNRLYIIITSDRGLAGAYNSAMLKLFVAELKKDRADGVSSHAILIGRQGARFAAKVEHLNIVAAYDHFPDTPTADDIRPILNTAIGLFTHQHAVKEFELDQAVTAHRSALKVDAVDILYTDYRSSITQVPVIQPLLPAVIDTAKSPQDFDRAAFEPSPAAVLSGVTPRLLEMRLYQAVLEAKASEHSMRMMAMKSASDNATDLVDDLTLLFNGARQAGITQELAEITGGAEAIA